jgi:hypothetical protein
VQNCMHKTRADLVLSMKTKEYKELYPKNDPYPVYPPHTLDGIKVAECISQENQRKLRSLKEEADQYLTTDYPPHRLSLRLVHIMCSQNISEFYSTLKQTEEDTQELLVGFVNAKQASMNDLKWYEDAQNIHCSNLTTLEKTWLQLKTYFTEGQDPLDFSWSQEKTAYERCSGALSRIQYYKKHTAELGKQIEVLEKIKSGLNECISSEPTAQEVSTNQ